MKMVANYLQATSRSRMDRCWGLAGLARGGSVRWTHRTQRTQRIQWIQRTQRIQRIQRTQRIQRSQRTRRTQRTQGPLVVQLY